VSPLVVTVPLDPMAAAEAARPWRAAEPAVTRVCYFNDNTEHALLAA